MLEISDRTFDQLNRNQLQNLGKKIYDWMKDRPELADFRQRQDQHGIVQKLCNMGYDVGLRSDHDLCRFCYFSCLLGEAVSQTDIFKRYLTEAKLMPADALDVVEQAIHDLLRAES